MISKRKYIRLVLPVLISIPVGAAAETNGFCIKNGSTEPALFVVDAGDAYREVAPLQPGSMLCTPELEPPAKGFVSVFTSEYALEGCSRLTEAGAVQVLLEYHDFDRCLWQDSP